MPNSPRVTLVFLAGQSLPAVTASLEAHVAAAGVLEDLGIEVGAKLVQCGPEPEVLRLLHAVEGATVSPSGTYTAPGRAWDQGLSDVDADLVYLCSAGSAPAPDALALLLRAFVDDPGLMVAVPGSTAPPAAMVSRALLRSVGGFAGLGLSNSATPVMSLSRFVQLVGRSARPPVVVAEARVGGVPLVQPARAARPGWRVGSFELAHADAVTVGAHTYFAKDSRCVTLSPLQRIEIGAFCSVADEARLLNPSPLEDVATAPDGTEVPFAIGGIHRPECATSFPLGRFPHLEYAMPFGEPFIGSTQRIGNDVWIGYRAMILGPVTVGDGAIIGAGAIVTRDVEPYTVVAGNPARVIRSRFAPEIVAALQRITWWTWTEEEIFARGEFFAGPIEDFVARFDPGTQSSTPSPARLAVGASAGH